jgi:hypothetical protein
MNYCEHLFWTQTAIMLGATGLGVAALSCVRALRGARK